MVSETVKESPDTGKEKKGFFSRVADFLKGSLLDLLPESFRSFVGDVEGYLADLFGVDGARKFLEGASGAPMSPDSFTKEMGKRYSSLQKMQTPEYMLDLAKTLHKKAPISKVSGDLHKNMATLNSDKYYPMNGGELCCARTVSHILGHLNNKGMGKDAAVMGLVPKLMAANLEKSGGKDTGVRFDNFIPGDVLVHFGNREGANHRYGHVSIVMERVMIDGEMFYAIAHDSARLEIFFLPADKGADTSKFSAMMKDIHHNPDKRDKIFSKYPKLAKLYKLRGHHGPRYFRVDNVKTVLPNKEGKGTVAFAVRTNTLV